MHRRLLCGVLTLCLVFGAVGCASFTAATPQKASWLDVFDTVTGLTVYRMDGTDFYEKAEQLHHRLIDYHRLFDIYHTYEGVNNLKTVNDNAGKAVAVDPLILDLLEYGLSMYERTDGRVNILFGAVLTRWHACRTAALADPSAARLPQEAALQEANRHTAPSLLEIDRGAGTVRLTDPQASLDVGAIAKGYAAELAAAYAAEELGFTSALLDVGGNLRAIGDKGGQPFSVGVKNPDADAARPYLLTVGVANGAAVTSGDYQRYFEVDGRRYAHIIDPDTLYPATYVRAVTVLCPHSGLADALSTALFVMPVEEGMAFLQTVPEAAAVWVLADGSLRYSPNFESYILA
ncbi:MAG: FAD:protein FMN transferase [Clostridia bacterium]|nr:FAD:protein FMN transferase [Clostridia bacterium]